MARQFSKLSLLSALLIFFVPLANFLIPENLYQLSIYDHYIILLSYFSFLFVILVISYLLSFKLNFENTFISLSLGFYLTFLFVPLQVIIYQTYIIDADNYFTLTRAASVLILFLIWGFISILIFSRFNQLIARAILIFAFSIIIYSISINITSVLFEESEEGIDYKFSENKISDNQSFDDSINKNIYFVILDAMIPLKMANDYDIFTEKELSSLRQEFKRLGLKTIENSFSGYGSTQYSLASLMRLEYPYTRNLRDGLWPSMMYQRQLKITVPELSKKRKNGFVWLGNHGAPCIERSGQPWECVHNNTIQTIMRISSTIYTNSIIELIINRLIWTKKRLMFVHDYDTSVEGGQRQLKHFIKNFDIDNQNRKNFHFIHQLSPHSPYSVNSECEESVKYIGESPEFYEGYKDSYKCVISEVLDFTDYISAKDPDSIIIFIGDHGNLLNYDIKSTSNRKIIPKLDDKGNVLNIFNMIKAPENCFNSFGEPRLSNNAMIFALNCGFGYNLKYFDKL